MSDLTPRQRFDALPEKVKEAAFDKHRYWNVDGGDDWWDGVYEGFVEDMKAAGIEIDRKNDRLVRGKRHSDPAIYFSGFCSQGDGACFEGRVADWTLAFTQTGHLTLLANKDDLENLNLSWASSGRYCHENTLDFNYDVISFPGVDSKDPLDLRVIANEQLRVELENDWESFVEAYREAVKNYCRKLYETLEAEHDYLTSDECILESLDSNDMLTEIIEEHENEESESA